MQKLHLVTGRQVQPRPELYGQGGSEDDLDHADQDYDTLLPLLLRLAYTT